MVLDGDYSDYILNDGSEIFTQLVASALDIEESQINILSVEQGSVIVRFEVISDTNLQDLKASLVQAIVDNQFYDENFPVVDAYIGEEG